MGALLGLLPALPTLISVVGAVAGLIHKHETTSPSGTSGAVKKAAVLTTVGDMAAAAQPLMTGFDLPTFISHVSTLIDAVVGIANALGVYAKQSPAVDTLTPSADGSTCAIAAIAAGVDTVTLALAVGGKSFSASLQLNITAAPQVLSSIGIANSVA